MGSTSSGMPGSDLTDGDNVKEAMLGKEEVEAAGEGG